MIFTWRERGGRKQRNTYSNKKDLNSLYAGVFWSNSALYFDASPRSYVFCFHVQVEILCCTVPLSGIQNNGLPNKSLQRNKYASLFSGFRLHFIPNCTMLIILIFNGPVKPVPNKKLKSNVSHSTTHCYLITYTIPIKFYNFCSKLFSIPRIEILSEI